MPSPGDAVLVDFEGATGIKRRPAVILSTELYHSHHLDVILGVLTTNVNRATTPTDYILKDWAASGLHAPSAFRAYVGTYLAAGVKKIGRLSEQDWQAVCVRLTLALSTS